MKLPQLLVGERHKTLSMIGQIGAGKSLVPSGSKALPEPIMTQIFVAIWSQ